MRIRLLILTLVLMPKMAAAQTQTGTAPASTLAPRPAALTPLEAVETAPRDVDAPPLAAGRNTRVVSKNEAYNKGRAADGRLGVRLGNDMSYRITGN